MECAKYKQTCIIVPLLFVVATACLSIHTTEPLTLVNACVAKITEKPRTQNPVSRFLGIHGSIDHLLEQLAAAPVDIRALIIESSLDNPHRSYSLDRWRTLIDQMKTKALLPAEEIERLQRVWDLKNRQEKDVAKQEAAAFCDSISTYILAAVPILIACARIIFDMH
jgi:hypothetical protein